MLSKTDTLLELKFATAKSNLPSLFTSPIVTNMGPVPVANSRLAVKLAVVAAGRSGVK